MPEFSKRALKSVSAFIKPRAILGLMLVFSLAVSALVFIGRINTYIIYYSGTSATVNTLVKDVHTALYYAGIDEDVYIIDSESDLGDNRFEVSLLKTFTVSVTAGDSTVQVLAREDETVGEVLLCAGFKTDEFDMIEPAADSIVTEGAYIDYVNIDYVSGSYTQAVPYSVRTVYSKELDVGKKVSTPGVDGLEQVNYTQKLVNGKVVETSVDSKVTLLAAKDSVQTIGTRRPAVQTSAAVAAISQLTPSSAIELDSNGNPVNYKKHITVQATAYTYTGHNCSTGVAPKPGYIAVNPKFIPYGTKMYIKSSDGRYVYGYAIAADTGGFIYSRPTNVDLFFPTVASMDAFGRRNVEIYILN